MPDRGRIRQHWFRQHYGAGGWHLAGLLACFAVAGYAALRWLDEPTAVRLGVWFVGALLLHDALLFPLYSLGDRVIRRATGVGAARTRRVPLVNHVRVPFLLSGLLLLLWFPLIFNKPEAAYTSATGLGTEPYLGRWLLVTAVLFAASALVYVVRVVLSGSSPRRGAVANSRHPLLERHRGRPAQVVSGPLRRRGHVPHVAEPVLAGDDRVRAAERARQRPGHLADGVRDPAADVVGRQLARPGRSAPAPPHRRRRRRGRGRSPAAAARPRTPAAPRPAASADRKIAATPAYGVSRGMPGAVDVVVAQRGRRPAGAARPGGRQVLLRDLAGGVGVARIQPGRLVDEAGPQPRGRRPGTAARSDPPPGPRRRRGPGATGPCSCAGVGALAVDDHRAGEDQPTDAGPRHPGQQDGGPEVVVPGVGGQVVEVDAEADHRRLVRDRVDAVERAVDGDRRRGRRRPGGRRADRPSAGVRCTAGSSASRTRTS